MQDNKAYCKHLFDDTTDGYIQVMQIGTDKAIRIYNTQNSSLKTIVESKAGESDVFVSSNTFYKPERSVEAIRQFRALYIDLDIAENDKTETVYMIYSLVNEGTIPEPSMIVDSGRGIHLYWKIKNAPYAALHTWQEIEDYLYSNLKHLGADLKATDGARVLRLPNTYNSKNNAECRILVLKDDIEYSMYDLRDDYLDYKPKQLELHQVKQISNKVISNRFYNSYSLHMARAEDIETLCRLRNYDLVGHRNFIIHCFAYWKGIYTRDPGELENEVIELNNAFTDPLKATEIKAVLRCIPKAIDKFIAYQNMFKSGQAIKVKKGAKDKQGYWYTNKTLINTLGITAQEQQHLKTIISTDEKYRRNNDKRTPRNEEGLTMREQQKQSKIEAVKKLHLQGFRQTEIAEELGISKGTVSKYLKFD